MTLLSFASIDQVLLGKVKKIQPPKGKKKVVFDPTPHYDCHVARIHPLLKDSIEDQAIGSLVGCLSLLMLPNSSLLLLWSLSLLKMHSFGLLMQARKF